MDTVYNEPKNYSHEDKPDMEVKGDDESASVGSSLSSSSEDDDISFVNDWIYQDTAWEELPEEVKTAARVFGWNAEIWDECRTPC